MEEEKNEANHIEKWNKMSSTTLLHLFAQMNRFAGSFDFQNKMEKRNEALSDAAIVQGILLGRLYK